MCQGLRVPMCNWGVAQGPPSVLGIGGAPLAWECQQVTGSLSIPGCPHLPQGWVSRVPQPGCPQMPRSGCPCLHAEDPCWGEREGKSDTLYPFKGHHWRGCPLCPQGLLVISLCPQDGDVSFPQECRIQVALRGPCQGTLYLWNGQGPLWPQGVCGSLSVPGAPSALGVRS